MGELIVRADGVWFRYAGAEADAVRDITLSVAPGELVGIVGPNGSGKTTLLRLVLGVLRPTAGAVEVAGQPVGRWSRRGLARLVGVVAQREEPMFPLRVDQTVLFGRYPHLGPLGAPRRHDLEAVQNALDRCDVADLAERWVDTLSGGEWQRVRIARALAQEPKALVLDEATANLDIRHEMEVFELAARLVRQEGIAAIVVTHHVNLVARYADRIVVMDRGAARASGRPGDVLRKEILEEVFEWPVAVTQWGGVPQYVPLRRDESGTDGAVTP
ncbi:MAG: ABC transporter ATP-binding protein [Gemmatimonadota bacterium]|nr:ABC transporter ATP-binding protein [Gemmatimonadota bacterium]MDH3368330.1 ABC transporter ATP-binding protein [Gemmatimonadota bacterium]MDH3478996.1 ABC transporter ATP-binding protein [Gemmatimonadota bacterium]MDH5549848.1 ABC transporter ATP-binding protein [Gemmatimonadota bacterium]